MNALTWTQEQAQFCSSIESHFNHHDFVLTYIQHDSSLSVDLPSWVVTVYFISGCSALPFVKSGKVLLMRSYTPYSKLCCSSYCNCAQALVSLHFCSWRVSQAGTDGRG